MKNTLLFITFFLYAIPTSAQSKYFERKYQISSNTNHNGFAILEDQYHNYVITGETLNDTADISCPFILVIDENGNVVNDNQYIDQNNIQTSGRDIVFADNTCALAGWGVVNEEAESYFIMLDSQYTLINSEYIGQLPYSDNPYTICRTSDNNFFLGGEIQPYDSTVSSPPTHPYLIKLDSSGNKLWDTIYYQFGPPHYSFFTDSKATSTGGALLLGTDRVSVGYYQGNILLIKIDSSGNILQQAIFNYGRLEYGSSITVTSDGGYLVTGGWMVFPDIAHNKGGVIIRLGSNMLEFWHNDDFFYNYVVSGGAIEAANGGYVISGSGEEESGWWGYELNAEIIKLSTDNELLWQRRYGRNNYSNDYVYDMIATSDGGYIMCGRFDTIGIAKIYVLKTNCMGLLTEPQAEFDTQTEADYTVSFFNQSQYTYPDSIDGGHYRWDFGDGSPPYTCGQGYAPCPAVVQHTYAQAGTYTAQLTAIVCSDTAQVTQTVAASAVGMPALVGQEGDIKVYPNPASETLSLRYKGTQAARWVLYDMSGRICKQLTL